MTTHSDPALSAVRRAREEISREFGNDPARLVAHYLKLQAEYRGRLIAGPEDEPAEQHAGTDRASPGR
jgi:hypothetical protein